MKKENKFVARVHETCIICGKDTNESLLLHESLGDLSGVDNKSIGFSKPCETCQGAIDEGLILFIIIDLDKSGDQSKPEEWYRCGNIFGIAKEKVKEALYDSEIYSAAEKHGFLLVDYRDAIKMGFPVTYDPKIINLKSKTG